MRRLRRSRTAAPAEEQTTFTVTKEQMEKMEGLSKLVSDVNDKYLRLAAEYDNYRKRTTREKENAYADAKADTIKPFLDGATTISSAALQQFEDGDPHRQGMEMICKPVQRRARKAGRGARFPRRVEPFDPQKHNAVMHVEDEALGENTVSPGVRGRGIRSHGSWPKAAPPRATVVRCRLAKVDQYKFV